jgi:hypothetical protein
MDSCWVRRANVNATNVAADGAHRSAAIDVLATHGQLQYRPWSQSLWPDGPFTSSTSSFWQLVGPFCSLPWRPDVTPNLESTPLFMRRGSLPCQPHLCHVSLLVAGILLPLATRHSEHPKGCRLRLRKMHHGSWSICLDSNAENSDNPRNGLGTRVCSNAESIATLGQIIAETSLSR